MASEIREATAAAKLASSSASADSPELMRALEKLEEEATVVGAVGDGRELWELCRECCALLGKATTSSELSARLHSFLTATALQKGEVRREMAGSAAVVGQAYEALRISLRAQAGPSALLQTLRLLHILTYDSHLRLGEAWSEDFLCFLVKEINRDGMKEAEWLPLCLGILCNVATHVPEQREWLKGQESAGALGKRLMGLLGSQSRAVVIFSLSLISLLHQRLLQTVFSKRNLNQTVPCIINVLIKGDGFLARATGVDLMLRLVREEGKTSLAELVGGERRGDASAIGHSLTSFPGLPRALAPVAACLVHLQPRSLDVAKLLDLFLVFTAIPPLRKPSVEAILTADPVKSKGLKTPLLALIDMSSGWQRSSGGGEETEVSLKALRLIRVCLEEMTESGTRVEEYVSPEPLVEVVERTVKTGVETGSGQAGLSSSRVLEGLRVAKAMAADDQLRSDVLEVVSGALCAHVSQFQLLCNPIVLSAPRPSLPSDADWPRLGVWIFVELMQLLAALKDHSGSHKRQYWLLLKEHGVLPLLAFGLRSSDARLVHASLTLVLHCSQVQNFDQERLSQLMAERGDGDEKTTTRTEQTEATNGKGEGGGGRETGWSREGIEEVLSRLKTGVATGGRASELATVYEAKIASLETALATGRRGWESEQAALRSLLRDGEIRAETAALESSRRLAAAEAELAEEQEMADKFRKNYKDMKAKFDLVSTELRDAKEREARSKAEKNDLRQNLAEIMSKITSNQ